MEEKHFESRYPDKTRFEEIEKVIEKLRSGRSCQVIGAPGVGKGSMLRFLPYNKALRTLHLGKDEPTYHFVYMDFSEVKNKNLSDIFKFILISLSYSLSERELNNEHTVLEKILKDVIKVPDEMVLFQALKQSIDYLANERELTTIFLIDRFEEYLPNVSPEFFPNLKILRNRAKYKFGVVIAATRPIEDIIETQVLGEFYEFLAGNIVYLPLHDKIGLDFRFDHLEKITGKKVNDKIKDEIIKLSGGHGKIARISYEATLASGGAMDLLDLLISNKQVRAGLFEIFRFLTPEEKADIKLKEVNEFLDNLGLTKNGKIILPLLSSFMDTALEQAIEKLSYNLDTNEIVRGEEKLSDKLSPSEFKLLKYLLMNQGRICEKDEIIQNVWKESKTQEGVTDQALDQIIYRLRKKVEKDPNSPKIIQTIKGRGYKLSE